MAYNQAQQIMSKGWLPGTIGGSTNVTIQMPVVATVETGSP